MMPISRNNGEIEHQGETFRVPELIERFPDAFPVAISAPGYNGEQSEAYLELSQYCLMAECGVLWAVTLRRDTAWRIVNVTADHDF